MNKLENTLENKAKFFGQYLGQNIIMAKHSDKPQLIERIWYNFLPKECYLLLTPLSQITDEDAIEVAKIVCKRHNRHYKPEEISYELMSDKPYVVLLVKGIARFVVQITSDGIAFIDFNLGGCGEIHYYCPGQYQATQYLISKGYYLGDGTEIEYGWVKLKGGSND